MFDALVNRRIDTDGLDFELQFADIEELNRGVVDGRADVSKISCAVLPLVAGRYAVLDTGSALGRGNGPLLVSSGGGLRLSESAHANERWGSDRYVGGDVSLDLTDSSLKIAVPGQHTTANLLMNKIFPHLATKEPVLFSEIAGAVADGRFDAGVLIHEGRFTYAEKGLCLESDLGVEWDRLTGLPLPLGAIVVSRELPGEVQEKVGRLLRRSIEYAFADPEAGAGFIRSHAQELSPEVLKSHIYMFVNDYSLSLGAEGRAAIKTLTGLDDKIFV